MQLSLLNRSNSKFDNDSNLNLMFIMVAISEKGYVTGLLSELMMQYIGWDSLNEQQKYVASIVRIKRHIGITCDEEYLQEFMGLYSDTREYRKTKNKSKEYIVILQKFEKALKNCLMDTKIYLEYSVIHFGLNELLDFFDPAITGFKRTKPFIAIKADSTASETYVDTSIKVFTDFITSEDRLTVMDGNIYEFEKGCEITEPLVDAEESTFLFETLCYIPALITLDSSQVRMARYELNTAFTEFFKNLETLNKELSKICFEKNNYEEIVAIYNKISMEIKLQLQQTIYNSAVMNSLKLADEEGEEYKEEDGYKITLGITSFETIINYYIKSEIENDSVISYVREEIEKVNSIKNSKFILIVSKKTVNIID